MPVSWLVYKVTHYPGFATLGFISAVVRYAPPPPPPPLRSSTLNGYVFGGGEWSYPGYTLNSEESKLSLEAAAATGANSMEFTPMVQLVKPFKTVYNYFSCARLCHLIAMDGNQS